MKDRRKPDAATGSCSDPLVSQTTRMHGLGNLSPAEREAYEERAAIAEYDGGMARPVAEREATRMIAEIRWWDQSGAGGVIRASRAPAGCRRSRP